MAKSEERKKECLKCGKMFKSDWSGNRICNKCKKRRSYTEHLNDPGTTKLGVGSRFDGMREYE